MGEPGEPQGPRPRRAATDPYRPTPDELYARGKALFDAGRLAEAAAAAGGALGRLHPPRRRRQGRRADAPDDPHQGLRPEGLVVYFEVLKEKDPEPVIPFDDILVVGRAYGDLGEHERAYLVWRAIAEASYLEDARVGEVLRQRGKTLEGIAYLLDLWREYPVTASIQSDFFGLSQVLAGLAGRATTDPALRRELADGRRHPVRPAPAGDPPDPGLPRAVARRTRWPTRRAWRSSARSWSWRTTTRSSRCSRRFAKLYPKSTFLDSFQYSRGPRPVPPRPVRPGHRGGRGDRRGHLQGRRRGRPAEPEQVAGPLHPRPDPRRPPPARPRRVDYYQQVADRFTDAAGAVKAADAQGAEAARGLGDPPGRGPRSPRRGSGSARSRAQRAATRGRPSRRRQRAGRASWSYRNIAEADVKVYPVDLMRLYLTRRNLDAIAGIDLAGITPLLRDDDQARRRAGTSTTRSARSTSR